MITHSIFIIPVSKSAKILKFTEDFPDIQLYLHGNSGFATPDLYEALEGNDCKYAIMLKENAMISDVINDDTSNNLKKVAVFEDMLYC